MGYYINNYRNIKLYVQELQAHGRTGEALLWYCFLKAKKKNGYEFHRHYSIEDTKVDFICKKLNLIIEINRDKRFAKLNPDKKKYEELKKLGYIILNYSESEVIYYTNEVVEHIKNTIELLEKRAKLLE